MTVSRVREREATRPTCVRRLQLLCVFPPPPAPRSPANGRRRRCQRRRHPTARPLSLARSLSLSLSLSLKTSFTEVELVIDVHKMCSCIIAYFLVTVSAPASASSFCSRNFITQILRVFARTSVPQAVESVRFEEPDLINIGDSAFLSQCQPLLPSPL
jgi:hypothetical protein